MDREGLIMKITLKIDDEGLFHVGQALQEQEHLRVSTLYLDLESGEVVAFAEEELQKIKGRIGPRYVEIPCTSHAELRFPPCPPCLCPAPCQRASWLRKCWGWILDEGCFLNECCRRLDENGVLTPDGSTKWARSVLRGILLDEANIGEFYAYKHKTVRGPNGKRKVLATNPDQWVLVYKDPEQAIFTPEQYQALKEKLCRNRENSPRHAIHWYPPLRGLVFCANCHTKNGSLRRMTGVTIKGIAYYRCEACGNLVNARGLWDSLREGIKTRILEPQRLVPGIKAQLQSGKSLKTLEEKLQSLHRESEGWQQSRMRARRLHLLPDSKYTLEQYLDDERRMQEQIQRLDDQITRVKQQLADLRQAIVDDEGVRHFCEQAAHNLGNMEDTRWRVLLERIRLRVEVPASKQSIVHIALPTVRAPIREIALETS